LVTTSSSSRSIGELQKCSTTQSPFRQPVAARERIRKQPVALHPVLANEMPFRGCEAAGLVKSPRHQVEDLINLENPKSGKQATAESPDVTTKTSYKENLCRIPKVSNLGLEKFQTEFPDCSKSSEFDTSSAKATGFLWDEARFYFRGNGEKSASTCQIIPKLVPPHWDF
jgi:hypothetical protein